MKMKTTVWLIGAAFLMTCVFDVSLCAQMPGSTEDGVAIREVLPTAADPALKTDFDNPNLVYVPAGKLRPELVVFLPGTHGKPQAYMTLQKAIAATGFRVAGLMYNDVPLEGNVCGAQEDPRCPGRFREERVMGEVPDAPVQNSVQESIVRRLVNLLKFEEKANPKEGWDAYLSGENPNWAKIIIAGHSQGAGMAAYIAKHHEVARAVLFSGGPDPAGGKSGTLRIASWVIEPMSKTPPDRWWAEYHAKEFAGTLLPAGYAALAIPKDHVIELGLEPPAMVKAQGLVAYHMAVIADPRYLPEWKRLFGIEPK